MPETATEELSSARTSVATQTEDAGNATPEDDLSSPSVANSADPSNDTDTKAEAASSSSDLLLVKREAPVAKPRTTTYVVAACVALLVALTMLGGVLTVGDHLMVAHPALGWVFYGLIAALVIIGIVIPIVKVAQRPIFSLYQLRDEQGRAKQRHCRMLVDNLVANTNLTDEDVAYLENCLQQGDKADDLLIEFFNERCIPAIETETKHAAGTAFFVSLVAHSPLVVTVTMLSICFDLVRSIVEVCGFRPTNLALARLYTRVMLSALIIGGIEDSDLSDLLGQLMGGGAGARAGGMVIGATAEGLVSAFLVFRVGVITKRWLTAADGPQQMSSIRRASYREALSLMRSSEFVETVTETVKKTSAAVASNVASSVSNAARTKAESTKNAVSNATRSRVDSAKSAISSIRQRFTHADQ